MLSEKLDPNLRAVLEAVRAQNLPPLESYSPQEARQVALENSARVQLPPEPVASVRDLLIPGPGGDIPIRIYQPAGVAPQPALVYFHGGGWVLCNLATHDTICRAIANRSGAFVVSVDYRVAPEHKYPAAVDDCYAAALWVAANAPSLGVDVGRIAVGGDSAGGNLAAVVCIRSRDEAGPRFAAQILVYPVADLSNLDTASYREFAEGHSLTRSLMAWFRNHYLADTSQATDPGASPLLTPDLGGLPPALILTAECDPLRDEGEAFATRLQQAGVAVKLTRYPGMIHPFFSWTALVPQAMEAIREVAEAVRKLPR